MSDWTVTTLGEVASLVVGKTPPRDEPSFWTSDTTLPFCTIADLGHQGELVDPQREGVTLKAVAGSRARKVPAGSLVMSFKLTLGKVAYAARDIYPNEALVWIQPDSTKVDLRYLGYWLQNLRLEEYSNQAVKGNTLNSQSLRALPVRFPGLEEQRRLVTLLETADEYVRSLQSLLSAQKVVRLGVLQDALQYNGLSLPEGWSRQALKKVTVQSSRPEKVVSTKKYALCGVRGRAQGMFLREEKLGSDLSATRLLKISAGEFIYNRLFAGTGSFALAPQDLDGLYVSNEFPTFQVDSTTLLPEYLRLLFSLPAVWEAVEAQCVGSTQSRSRWSESRFGDFIVPLPPLDQQQSIASLIGAADAAIDAISSQVLAAETLRQQLLQNLLTPKDAG